MHAMKRYPFIGIDFFGPACIKQKIYKAGKVRKLDEHLNNFPDIWKKERPFHKGRFFSPFLCTHFLNFLPGLLQISFWFVLEKTRIEH